MARALSRPQRERLKTFSLKGHFRRSCSIWSSAGMSRAFDSSRLSKITRGFFAITGLTDCEFTGIRLPETKIIPARAYLFELVLGSRMEPRVYGFDPDSSELLC
mmetsp:Transcript_13366/g.19265  ORF Transcript_13366/g.19265 Transcript_13366/m.19265 type:complete len:104 (-) Transcript_13366:818-1129(-)